MNWEEIIQHKINDYTQKYANKHHITVEEAKKHSMVKIAEHYFRKSERLTYDIDR